MENPHSFEQRAASRWSCVHHRQVCPTKKKSAKCSRRAIRNKETWHALVRVGDGLAAWGGRIRTSAFRIRSAGVGHRL